MGINACVMDATGLVGSELLPQLRGDAAFNAVHVMARPALDGRLVSTRSELFQQIVDFDQLDRFDWPDCDVLFCCIGTILKTAGPQPAFRKVDLDYVVGSARRARQSGASQLVIVSALEASSHSRVDYHRIKSEMEQAVVALGFESVVIVRPSLLAEQRSEGRRGEKLTLAALKVGNLFLPKKYRSLHPRAVARVMVAAAKGARPGVTIIESDQIHKFS